MVYFDLTFEYFLFGCFCVSMPVYIWVLFTLLFRVPKSDSILGSKFFTIVLSTGIADILTAIHTYVYYKFRLWGWAFGFYEFIHPVFKYELLIGYATTSSQSIGTILMALNRFTALATPLRHKIFWSTARVRWCLAVQWVIPLLISVPGAFLQLAGITFNQVPNNGVAVVNGINYTGLITTPVFTTRLTDLARMTSTIYQTMSIVIWIISFLFTYIIYLSLFIILRRRRHFQDQNQNSALSSAATFEFRLLAYGLITAAIQMTTAVLEILIVIDGFNTWYRPTAAAIDAANYSHPYFLLALSSTLRQRCFPCLNKKSGTAVQPSENVPKSTIQNANSQLVKNTNE